MVIGEILVVAESRAGRLAPVSLELAAFARQMASAEGEHATGVALGFPARPVAEEFACATGLPTLALENEHLAGYHSEAYLSVLTRLVTERRPELVLIAHSAVGADFAPRLAVALGGSCCTGVHGLAPGEPRRFRRAICGGKLMAEVAPIPGQPAVVTLMPGAFPPREPGGRSGEVVVEQVAVDCRGVRVLGEKSPAPREVDLSRAEVIVAAGRGLAGPEHLHLVQELAALCERGAVGASRPVVDAGWLGLEHQVGMTGQTVAPKVYIACGISGAIQHTQGMSRSGLIVAINQDPEAAIFQIAHLGVVADLHRFLPVLLGKLRERKPRPV